MSTSDDNQLRDAAVAGKMINASKNEDLPKFVRDMAAHTAGVIIDRLSEEHSPEEQAQEGQGD
ncbi:hypothetical protein ACFWJS_33890 [Streptomyces sp. NPDC127061]|uniref:hypothetical protein n=1 Tax=Streptomyces sp. NPDC127061 TaxID=3347122 RepID=UPI0036571532